MRPVKPSGDLFTHNIHGTTVYLPTIWLVFDGFHVGRYTATKAYVYNIVFVHKIWPHILLP